MCLNSSSIVLDTRLQALVKCWMNKSEYTAVIGAVTFLPLVVRLQSFRFHGFVFLLFVNVLEPHVARTILLFIIYLVLK